MASQPQAPLLRHELVVVAVGKARYDQPSYGGADASTMPPDIRHRRAAAVSFVRAGRSGGRAGSRIDSQP